jgi:hypothetical protein
VTLPNQGRRKHGERLRAIDFDCIGFLGSAREVREIGSHLNRFLGEIL